MEENIEVKDVQKTEYLDKTGLDMLWTKVKENTHNQVEVEYNRAKAKEDSLSQEIASVKPAEGKEFLQVEEIYNTKTLKDGPLAFGDISNQAGVTKYAVAQQEGFLVYSAKDEPFDFKTVNILSTGIQSEDERKSDTNVWNTNGGITDLTSYALNSDVAEKIAAKADTTALTALEEKVTANTTAIEGKQDAGNYIPYEYHGQGWYELPYNNSFLVKEAKDDESVYTSMGPDELVFYKNDKRVYVGNGVYDYGVFAGQLSEEGAVGSSLNIDGLNIYQYNDDLDGAVSIVAQLDKKGIKLYNGRDDEVLTSNASTIDITQYVLKSVYDEKIAALEARIAALEAKHTETA